MLAVRHSPLYKYNEFLACNTSLLLAHTGFPRLHNIILSVYFFIVHVMQPPIDADKLTDVEEGTVYTQLFVNLHNALLLFDSNLHTV